MTCPSSAVPSEHVEQREFVMWFRQTFEGVRIFAIPNGGKRSKAEALRLKAEGVSAGVPDLYVPAWHLWIEMKRQAGGVLSSEQKDWRDYLLGIGDGWIVAKGRDDAVRQVELFRRTAKENTGNA